MKTMSRKIVPNCWFLPVVSFWGSLCICVLGETFFKSNQFLGFSNLVFRDVWIAIGEIAVLLVLNVCAAVTILCGYNKINLTKWRISCGLMVMSLSLMIISAFRCRMPFEYAYYICVSYLFPTANDNHQKPSLDSVAIRKSGELTHAGQSVRLYGDGGYYRLAVSVNTHSPGRLFLEAYEVSTGLRLSAANIKRATEKDSIWSNDANEWFSHDSSFLIMEGRRNRLYNARFELWFYPSDGGESYRIWADEYSVSGFWR